MLTSLIISRWNGRLRESEAPSMQIPVLPVALAVVLLLNVVATAGMLISLD